MRIAALYDVHANLPALDAVLAEVHAANVDLIVFGGDILPGPMPRETLARVLHLDTPTQFIHGNGELAVLAMIDASDPKAVAYTGTTSGGPLPEPYREVMRWTAKQVRPDYKRVLEGFEGLAALIDLLVRERDRLGDVVDQIRSVMVEGAVGTDTALVSHLAPADAGDPTAQEIATVAFT